MATEKSIWDDYENVGGVAIQEPPTDDGVYKVRIEVGDDAEDKNTIYLSLVVVEDEKWSNHSILKTLPFPSLLEKAGKVAGANLSMKTFKSALVSAGVDSKAVQAIKLTGREGDFARAKLLNNKVGYIYFLPAVLTRKGDYPETTFITKADYEAKRALNGSKVAALAAAPRPAPRTASGQSSSPSAGADLSDLDDNLSDIT